MKTTPSCEVKGFALFVLAVILATACTPAPDPGCELFAEMESRCELKSNETPRVRQLAVMVCSEAQTEGDWLSQLQARQVMCAQASASCEVYQDCKFEIALP